MIRPRLLLVFALLLASSESSAAPKSTRPARAPKAVASGDWLRALCLAAPEMGLESGVNECAPRLDDYSAAGQQAVLGAIERGMRANAGDTPDARLVRARLVRERMLWKDLAIIPRDPGKAYPVTALTQPLVVPGVSNLVRLEWAGARMDAAPLRVGVSIRQPGPLPAYFISLSRQTLARSSLLAAAIADHATGEGATPVVHQRMDGAVSRMRVMSQNADFYFTDQAAKAAGDPRPDSLLYTRLLREGYGFDAPAESLEARLDRATRAARREVDSLTRSLDATHTFRQLLAVLEGSHPISDELLARVGSAFRAQETASAARWPALPTEPLEITETGVGRLHQSAAVTFLSARPLAGPGELPAYAITLPDPAASAQTQEAVLSQCNHYVNQVAAARHDAPGEATLWRIHRSGPPARLWAASPHTSPAWGYFAQELCARAGLFQSTETRLVEAWSRLVFLARGRADLRLGLHRADPPVVALELEETSGQETGSSLGSVNAALETPGSRAGPALRMLQFRNDYELLRARGASEAESLKQLAESALYLPADQARMLGLQP